LPVIPFNGNCSLEQASMPLYGLLLDYFQKNPSKSIHLIACSNGCRIASWIECELRNIIVNIRITCIAGAFGGSIIIDKFNLPLSTILHNDIIRDLTTNSDTNNKLKENMNLELENGSRFYEFYGTANDWYIPNFNGCFPYIEQNNNIINKNFKVVYHDLKYGYDHVSLGWYLSDEIITNSIGWFKFNNDNK
jgi:hypothetical protein